jgi:protein-S-isoprenylcysteine O-methyltransferase Ste14
LPAAVERSTYVLSAGLLLILLFWQWHPVPTEVWRVRAHPWDNVAWALYAFGWLIALSSTFMIDHLDFLGFRQAYAYGRSYRPPRFAERWLYAWVRHPMMLGLVIAFWATPSMTIGHLFFAAGGTGYILLGLHFEERELVRDLGDAYVDYARRVPRVVPLVRGLNARSSRNERTSLAD